jgi:hypothetical protein
VRYHEGNKASASTPSTEKGRPAFLGVKISCNVCRLWSFLCSFLALLLSLQSVGTASIDSDKIKTWDYARLEYSHVLSFMPIDSDELLFCPDAMNGIRSQRSYQKEYLDKVVGGGSVEEIIVLRRNYDLRDSLLMSRGPQSGSKGGEDEGGSLVLEERDRLVRALIECTEEAYGRRSTAEMLSCWSPSRLVSVIPPSISRLFFFITYICNYINL